MSSSSQDYHSIPAVYTSESLSNANAINATAQWYPPTTYEYDSSFLTPLPSSTAEGQAYLPYAVSTGPEAPLPQYAMQPQSMSVPNFQASSRAPSRPTSSTSKPESAAEQITWPVTSGLGIYDSPAFLGQPTPVTSTFPPPIFQTYTSDIQYTKEDDSHLQQAAIVSSPELQQPTPQRKRSYTHIAPDPIGATGAQQKRKRDDDVDFSDASMSGKKRKRTSSVVSTDLSEDERRLLNLKEDQSLPWKDIAARVSVEKGKTVNVAALQMQYKRLREKHRVWTEQDLDILKQTYDWYEKRKWDIIADKMIEFGLKEKWNPKQLSRKWQELEMSAVSMAGPVSMTPAMSQFSTSQFSSPIEAPAPYPWMPLP